MSLLSELDPAIAALITHFENLGISNSEENLCTLYHKDRPDGDLTPEEYDQYYESLAKSEGFDVPFFRYAVIPGLIVPVFKLEVYKDQLVRYGALAIEHYNQQNGTDFEIVEFVKLNVEVVQGLNYYMTFKAKPRGSLFTTTFQALVYGGIDETEVDICRKLLPSP